MHYFYLMILVLTVAHNNIQAAASSNDESLISSYSASSQNTPLYLIEHVVPYEFKGIHAEESRIILAEQYRRIEIFCCLKKILSTDNTESGKLVDLVSLYLGFNESILALDDIKSLVKEGQVQSCILNFDCLNKGLRLNFHPSVLYHLGSGLPLYWIPDTRLTSNPFIYPSSWYRHISAKGVIHPTNKPNTNLELDMLLQIRQPYNKVLTIGVRNILNISKAKK